MTETERGNADELGPPAEPEPGKVPRRSENNFRAMVDIAPLGLFHTNAHGDVTYINREWCRLSGMTSEAAMGKGWVKAIHPDDREKVSLNWDQAVKTGKLFENEVRYMDSSGVATWCFVRAVPQLDASGSVIGYVGALTDITERRRAEIALRGGENRFRELLESAPDAMVIVDPQGKIVLVNKQTETIFGYTREQLLGSPVEILIPQDIRTGHVEKRAAFTASPQLRPMGQKAELFGVTREGRKFPVEISLSPIQTEEGLLISAAVRDITETKLAEAQLHQAQKMEAVGQLTGGVAHDFNNSLAIILGNADMLADELGEKDARVQAVLRAAMRAAELTQRLLAFSRQQPLHPKAIDPGTLVAGMIDMLRRSLGEAIDIEFVMGKGLWTATADPGQLESALLNLAINARDAMSGAGTLVIEAGNAVLDEDYAAKREGVVPGDYVLLAITDTGTGMPPKVLKRVFEPFFTTKEVGKGTGLGLSMVFGFARQSSGHVAIYSEEGKGTTVKLYLPRTRESAESTTAPANRDLPRGRGETVLVVEDDEDVREFAVMLLEGLGYRVLDAHDGKSGLAVVEASPGIDLLLTDMVMAGGMSGRELADEAARLNHGLKVLFMSGYTEIAVNLNGWVSKGDELLQKPFRKRDMATRVRSVLDRVVD
jgi:PAS domain S-box-containing protein